MVTELKASKAFRTKREKEEKHSLVPFCVDCSSVRFGSYHTKPIGQIVQFSSESVTFTVPVWKKSKRTAPSEMEFTFRFDDVLEGKFHFGPQLSAVFMKLHGTEKHCHALGLIDDGRGPYWCHEFGYSEEGKKWLVLVLPASLTNFQKETVKGILLKSSSWITFRQMNSTEACAALMMDHPSAPISSVTVPSTRKFKRPSNL